MLTDPVIRLIDLTKTFGETNALAGVCLDLFPRQVVGLVGPNGSGKTTLTNILCGRITPDSGEIWIEGRPVKIASSSEAITHGIRMLPQSLEIYPQLSVLENIFMGQEIKRKIPLGLMAWKQMNEIAKRLLTRVDASSISPSTLAGRLSGGQQKAVAFARLLACQARILVFDEPAASLGIRQKNRLLDVMSSEAADGRAIIFVSHDIEDVLSICDRVVVLRKGHIVADNLRENTDKQALFTQMSLA